MKLVGRVDDLICNMIDARISELIKKQKKAGAPEILDNASRMEELILLKSQIVKLSSE